jgi:hypothetical protein
MDPSLKQRLAQFVSGTEAGELKADVRTSICQHARYARARERARMPLGRRDAPVQPDCRRFLDRRLRIRPARRGDVPMVDAEDSVSTSTVAASGPFDALEVVR